MASWIPRRPRSWRIFFPFAVVLLLAVAWTVFWYRAAQATEATVAAWVEREAAAGRVYSCASRSVGGYPFRIEVRCTEPVAQWSGLGSPWTIKAQALIGVAQVYQPNLLIAEITGPLLIAEAGRPLAHAEWKLAQASLRGLPPAPERISVVIDNARVERAPAGGAAAWMTADKLEFHVRLAPVSAGSAPVLEFALRAGKASSPIVGFLAKPADADVTAILRGLNDLRPKPLAERLRELQASGGRLEVTQARIERDRAVTVASGGLGLNTGGRLDGLFTITMAGLENLSLGLGGAELGLTLLGKPTELEGKRAVVLPLRIRDGAVSLGPLPLGRVPPLY